MLAVKMTFSTSPNPQYLNKNMICQFIINITGADIFINNILNYLGYWFAKQTKFHSLRV